MYWIGVAYVTVKPVKWWCRGIVDLLNQVLLLRKKIEIVRPQEIPYNQRSRAVTSNGEIVRDRPQGKANNQRSRAATSSGAFMIFPAAASLPTTSNSGRCGHHGGGHHGDHHGGAGCDGGGHHGGGDCGGGDCGGGS